MKSSKGDTDIQNRLLDSVGAGEGGMIGEKSIETYTLPYIKYLFFFYFFFLAYFTLYNRLQFHPPH